MKFLKKLFNYFEPLWLGNDKKISLRSTAAIALIVDFIINVHNSASMVVKVLNLMYYDKQIDAALIAAMAGNLAQIAMILGIEAALIAALLALKSYQGNVAALSGIAQQNQMNQYGGMGGYGGYGGMGGYGGSYNQYPNYDNPPPAQTPNNQEGIISH